jgi:hypothetical protein
MTEQGEKADYKSIFSNQVHMRSFRVSVQLEELIMNECKKRNTDFSSFIRDACLDAIFNRPWQSDQANG